MAVQFYVNLQDLNGKTTPELLYMENNGMIQIGTSYANGDRRRTLLNLIQEQLGEWSPGTFSGNGCPTIEELKSSDKQYFSKWAELPIEFFNTVTRFSWYLPTNLMDEEEPDKKHQENFAIDMLHFWDSILNDSTPIVHSSSHPIDTWADLKNAIFGQDKYMEPSKFVQGIMRSYSPPNQD